MLGHGNAGRIRFPGNMARIGGCRNRFVYFLGTRSTGSAGIFPLAAVKAQLISR
jgi:hypothetical protein